MNKPGECKDCRFMLPVISGGKDGYFCTYTPKWMDTVPDHWCAQFKPKEERKPEEIKPEPGYFISEDGNYYHIVAQGIDGDWFVNRIEDVRCISLCCGDDEFPKFIKKISVQEWSKRLS